MTEVVPPRELVRAIVVAGHQSDGVLVEVNLHHGDADVRGAALGALARIGTLTDRQVTRALADVNPKVRTRATELASLRLDIDLAGMLSDHQDKVVDTAAWAIGERSEASPAEHAALQAVAKNHTDALCRESAVAALGALGDPAGLQTILDATTDKPAVRRRAILALAPFDGPEVEAALEAALSDRDWQVRQAAEDLS